MATLVCDIVTPEQRELSQECAMVSVPGDAGHMGFLPGHAPLMSTLADGEVRVYSDMDTVSHRFACQGGYVQVTGGKVIVLADRAIAAEDIDVAEAKAKVAELQSKLDAGGADADSEAERGMLAYDLKWYKTLEHVAGNR